MTLHFVYGSLMSPEVVKELLGRIPPQIPGTLFGYTRWRVPDQVYPGILPGPVGKSEVPGFLVKDLLASEVEIFDAFEGDDYIKTPVTIRVSEASPHLHPGEHQAWAYVWKPVPGQPLVEHWDYEKTFLPHLEDYLASSREFRDSLTHIPRP
ncbi:aig2-like protein [Nannochloropsis gaditana]|uniref:Putative gamma-glutamylcyclotransferase n=1 Tax=Nannochloropsis gaditana TaxID=72520 RepID=W7T0R7_9STRA|nr:aig2-like protein [Nannochloropsis gaditana]